MAGCGYFDGEDELHKSCEIRTRQFSDASTAAPASPPMSRLVSPHNLGDITEEIGDRLAFEFIGLPDEMSDDFNFRELPHEISSAVLPTITAAQSTANSGKSSAHSSTGCMIFLPTLFGLFLYALVNSTIFRISMGVVTILMLLPGIYLYFVDGCRPEDFDKQAARRQSNHGALAFVLTSLTLVSFYGAYISAAFRAVMWTLAALMVLPGLYLHVVDGCRPEDYDEEVGGGFNCGALVLSLLGLGSWYCMYVSLVFRVCMGTVAALMLMPGLYLYIVDGCRPEDYEQANAEDDSIIKNVEAFLLPVASFLSIYGMHVSMVFRFCMGTGAALLLLPGAYLYVVDGCRPEDCEELETDTSATAGVPAVILALLGSFYGLYVSTVFRVIMAIVAASMLAPGLYLYAVDGCRPEDYEERGNASLQNCAGPALALAGFGWVYGMYASMLFRGFMGSMAVLIITPGIYLYFADGCRPEDYEEDNTHNRKNAEVFALSLVSLGSCYGMYVSTVFCIFMGTVIVLMLLPGLYLYFVDGCRPEDYEEQEVASQNGAVLAVSFVGLASFYGMYCSMAFRIFMGVLATVMFLPGLHLYVVDGCRPEDIAEEFCLKED